MSLIPRYLYFLFTLRHDLEYSIEDPFEEAARQFFGAGTTFSRVLPDSLGAGGSCTIRESSEFYTRHHDAQTDRAAVRAEIEVLRRERLAYEQESIQTRQDLARSEAHCRALEARVTVLETDARRHEVGSVRAADESCYQYINATQALRLERLDTWRTMEAVLDLSL
ncbi:hypothetical protein Tco_0012831 [Tanacetum coccineum]